jgi:hypothetical protein
MTTKEIIDRIFKEPGIKFETLWKPIHEIIFYGALVYEDLSDMQRLMDFRSCNERRIFVMSPATQRCQEAYRSA